MTDTTTTIVEAFEVRNETLDKIRRLTDAGRQILPQIHALDELATDVYLFRHSLYGRPDIDALYGPTGLEDLFDVWSDLMAYAEAITGADSNVRTVVWRNRAELVIERECLAACSPDQVDIADMHRRHIAALERSLENREVLEAMELAERSEGGDTD